MMTATAGTAGGGGGGGGGSSAGGDSVGVGGVGVGDGACAGAGNARRGVSCSRPATQALAVLCLVLSSCSAAVALSEGRCSTYEKVQVCHSRMGYNMTLWPNSLDESTAEAAIERMNNMNLLVRTHCHPWLFAFLCFTHVPHCENVYVNNPRRHKARVVGPCRELCEAVRDACTPYIVVYNRTLTWPNQLYNCSKYISYPGQCFFPTGDMNESKIPNGYDWGTKISVSKDRLNPKTTMPTVPVT